MSRQRTIPFTKSQFIKERKNKKTKMKIDEIEGAYMKKMVCRFFKYKHPTKLMEMRETGVDPIQTPRLR